MDLPEWAAPPGHVLPEVVPVELLVARSERAAVLVHGVRAFPTGVGLTLLAQVRDPRDGHFLHAGWYGRGEVGDAVLRFGVELADGRRVTNLDPPFEEPPERPVLVPRGGSGGGHFYVHGYWLWPLPPAGRLTFAAEWPALGIRLSRVETDADEIRAAAGRAVALWPEGGPP